MAKKSTGQYRWRLIILTRTLGAKGANGEDAETWPDPTPGTGEYQAARDTFSAGETIIQGLRQSTGSMKFRIKGGQIAVTAADRVRVKTSGEVFNVTAVSRDEGTYETILTLERVHEQTVSQ